MKNCRGINFKVFNCNVYFKSTLLIDVIISDFDRERYRQIITDCEIKTEYSHLFSQWSLVICVKSITISR